MVNISSINLKNLYKIANICKICFSALGVGTCFTTKRGDGSNTMSLSVFDIFRVGIGPSSSHTVGPMTAAHSFVGTLLQRDLLQTTERVKVQLFGSLGATGRGHGSPKAVMLGLEGETSETADPAAIPARVARLRQEQRVNLLGRKSIAFVEARDLLLEPQQSLPLHANGMQFTAFSASETILHQHQYYSVGGGFVVDQQAATQGQLQSQRDTPPHEFNSAAQLLAIAAKTGLSISQIMLENELHWGEQAAVYDGLDRLCQVMSDTIERGLTTQGVLPGGLHIKRRAPQLYTQLSSELGNRQSDGLAALDWVSLYAMAVNEENAAGGRIVTAPTNGAAGIIPAVLRYFTDTQFGHSQVNAIQVNSPTQVNPSHVSAGHTAGNRAMDNHAIDNHARQRQSSRRFLLTAAAIGILYKKNASISGAEVGCQGEVGSACSMAAGALAEVLGGTPEQVENAAEIAMEHNLGLTCDPIGGLVQVPCIERNAMAAIKAISAARLALRGDGKHLVSLDKVIQTMRETGRDMKDKYKETATGGLAAHGLEVPVNIIEC